MGHFGFSYIGLITLLLLFIPNLLWTRCQPADYSAENENRVLMIFEKAGQVLVTCIALIFSDFNLQTLSPWLIWLVLAAVAMALYEFCWIRYFIGEHTVASFYRSLWGIPVPLAVLPVVAFFCLGIYGKVVWMLLAVVLLGIGHIGIHLQHLKVK